MPKSSRLTLTGRTDNPISESLIGERDEPKINIRWGGEGVMGVEALPKSCVMKRESITGNLP